MKDSRKHRKRGTRVQGLLSLDELHNTLRGLLPKANLVPTALPLVPSISLYLLDDLWPREQIEAPVINALMADPPYWTFCWASGQRSEEHTSELQSRGQLVFRLLLAK